jgi:hypothetical protein
MTSIIRARKNVLACEFIGYGGFSLVFALVKSDGTRTAYKVGIKRDLINLWKQELDLMKRL